MNQRLQTILLFFALLVRAFPLVAQEEAKVTSHEVRFNTDGVSGYAFFRTAPSTGFATVIRAFAGEVYITNYKGGRYDEALADAGIEKVRFPNRFGIYLGETGYHVPYYQFKLESSGRFRDPTTKHQFIGSWFYSERFVLRIINSRDGNSVNDFLSLDFEEKHQQARQAHREKTDEDVWHTTGELANLEITELLIPDFHTMAEKAMRDWLEKQQEEEENEADGFWEGEEEDTDDEGHASEDAKTEKSDAEDDFWAGAEAAQAAGEKQDKQEKRDADFWTGAAEANGGNDEDGADFWSGGSNRGSGQDANARRNNIVQSRNYGKNAEGRVVDTLGNELIPWVKGSIRNYDDGIAYVTRIVDEVEEPDFGEVILEERYYVNQRGQLIPPVTKHMYKPYRGAALQAYYSTYGMTTEEIQALEASQREGKRRREEAERRVYAKYRAMGYQTK